MHPKGKFLLTAVLLISISGACSPSMPGAPNHSAPSSAAPASLSSKLSSPTAMSKVQTPSPWAGAIPTGSPLPPYATPTFYYSAPLNGELDHACRITIDMFFSYRQGFSIESYRNLFIPSSQHLADSIKPPLEASVLLKLEPVSQWWQENYPDKLIPGADLPQEPDEYLYYAEYTYSYDPSTTPIFPFPDEMTIHMISDGPASCKIKGYGKG